MYCENLAFSVVARGEKKVILSACVCVCMCGGVLFLPAVLHDPVFRLFWSTPQWKSVWRRWNMLLIANENGFESNAISLQHLENDIAVILHCIDVYIWIECDPWPFVIAVTNEINLSTFFFLSLSLFSLFLCMCYPIQPSPQPVHPIRFLCFHLRVSYLPSTVFINQISEIDKIEENYTKGLLIFFHS